MLDVLSNSILFRFYIIVTVSDQFLAAKTYTHAHQFQWLEFLMLLINSNIPTISALLSMFRRIRANIYLNFIQFQRNVKCQQYLLSTNESVALFALPFLLIVVNICTQYHFKTIAFNGIGGSIENSYLSVLLFIVLHMLRLTVSGVCGCV